MLPHRRDAQVFSGGQEPAVNIKDDVSPAYQLRRYAWSAKLPLSILTDFAEFAVYDCRILPKPADKASTARILYLTYKDYAERWEEIAGIFSREAVLKGSFDKYAEAKKGKRGTSPVDKEFLAEIETWRASLAKNLARRNPKLSVRDLNFAVQRTIDRIIFLRMCEDRGVENYAQLQALLNGENIYKRLQYLYNLADDKYNSGIFHFRPEPKPLPRVVNLKIEENLAGGDSRTETAAHWVLQELKPGDLTKVNRPLKKVDLPDWNITVAHMDAPTLFEKGLENLEKILQKAEKEI